MGSEVIAGVFPSKAEEDIIAPLEKRRRRRRRRISHCEAVERWSLRYELWILGSPVGNSCIKGIHNEEMKQKDNKVKFDYLQKKLATRNVRKRMANDSDKWWWCRCRWNWSQASHQNLQRGRRTIRSRIEEKMQAAWYGKSRMAFIDLSHKASPVIYRSSSYHIKVKDSKGNKN